MPETEETEQHKDEGTEWVGGRLPARTRIDTSEGTLQPHIVLWLDVGSQAVVASQVVYPNEPLQAVIACLRRAMQEPLHGRPRRPKRVRVAGVELAEAVRRELPEAEVIVAPTPELDALLDSIAGCVPHRHSTPSYLGQGRVRQEVVATFFEAARDLWQAAPWNSLRDDVPISFDAPSLGLRRACLAAIGSLGEQRGLLLFSSIDAYRVFVRRAHASSCEPVGRLPEVSIFSVTFERGSEVPAPMRREIARFEWPVAGPYAYPLVVRLDPENVCQGLSEPDYRMATAAATAVTALCKRHHDRLQAVERHPITEVIRIRDEDGTEQVLTATVPHEGASLVYGIEEPRDPSSPGASAVAQAQMIGPLEPEDDNPLDHEAFELLGDFLEAKQLDGWDEALCDVADTACSDMLLWKLHAQDGRLDRWTAAQVELYLLTVFPERFSGDDAALLAVPDAISALFEWMGQVGYLSCRSVDAARRRISNIRARFFKAAPGVHMSAPGDLIQIKPLRDD